MTSIRYQAVGEHEHNQSRDAPLKPTYEVCEAPLIQRQDRDLGDDLYQVQHLADVVKLEKFDTVLGRDDPIVEAETFERHL